MHSDSATGADAALPAVLRQADCRSLFFAVTTGVTVLPAARSGLTLTRSISGP